jgi:hypothetical protein
MVCDVHSCWWWQLVMLTAEMNVLVVVGQVSGTRAAYVAPPPL